MPGIMKLFLIAGIEFGATSAENQMLFGSTVKCIRLKDCVEVPFVSLLIPRHPMQIPSCRCRDLVSFWSGCSDASYPFTDYKPETMLSGEFQLFPKEQSAKL